MQSSVWWQSSWGLTNIPLIANIAWHVYCIHCFSQVFSIFVLLFKCGHSLVYVHVLFLLCLGSVILLFQLLSLDAVELLLDGNTPGSKIISILFVRFQNLPQFTWQLNDCPARRPDAFVWSLHLPSLSVAAWHSVASCPTRTSSRWIRGFNKTLTSISHWNSWLNKG